MIHLLHQHILPAAYAVLPDDMRSDQATAMLLAIALQESACTHRRQISGPARGFWQFEVGLSNSGVVVGGVAGVMKHAQTQRHVVSALEQLKYPKSSTARSLHAVIEHNDVMAAVFARLLLWTVPDELPTRQEPMKGWGQYLDGWRPGKPWAATWPGHFERAWSVVDWGKTVSDPVSTPPTGEHTT